MSDDIQTVQMDYTEAMEMLWRQSQTIKRLQQENEKLRAALKQIAETYNKPTTSKDGLAFIAAAALKEINDDVR